jgi:hypothetical protein
MRWLILVFCLPFVFACSESTEPVDAGVDASPDVVLVDDVEVIADAELPDAAPEDAEPEGD